MDSKENNKLNNYKENDYTSGEKTKNIFTKNNLDHVTNIEQYIQINNNLIKDFLEHPKDFHIFNQEVPAASLTDLINGAWIDDNIINVFTTLLSTEFLSLKKNTLYV